MKILFLDSHNIDSHQLFAIFRRFYVQCSMERILRNFIVKSALGKLKSIHNVYLLFNKIRYYNKWEEFISFRNIHLKVGKDDSIFPTVKKGIFEVNEIDFFINKMSKCSVFYDVGANVGIYSIIGAKTYKNVQIFAFEPVASTRLYLKENLIFNNISNVLIIPYALGNSNSVKKMYKVESAPGVNSLIGSRFLSYKPTSYDLIEVRKLDDVFLNMNLPKPDFIKVDIEGYEPYFVDGSIELIQKYTPLLMLEVNWSYFQRDTQNSQNYSKMLDSLLGIYKYTIAISEEGFLDWNQETLPKLAETFKVLTLVFSKEKI